MCEFPSWLRNKVTGEVLFLKDKDIAPLTHNLDRHCDWEDFIGHSAIMEMYGINLRSDKDDWMHQEETNPPREVLNAMFCGEMNRMAIAADYDRVIVGGNYTATRNERVLAYNGAIITAKDEAIVVAHDNCRVIVSDASYVLAHDNCCVDATGDAKICACNNCEVHASCNAVVDAYFHTQVTASGNTRVFAYGKSYVNAREYAIVEARNHATVHAYDHSHVTAYGSSRVIAHQKSCVNGYEDATIIRDEGGKDA